MFCRTPKAKKLMLRVVSPSLKQPPSQVKAGVSVFILLLAVQDLSEVFGYAEPHTES